MAEQAANGVTAVLGQAAAEALRLGATDFLLASRPRPRGLAGGEPRAVDRQPRRAVSERGLIFGKVVNGEADRLTELAPQIIYIIRQPVPQPGGGAAAVRVGRLRPLNRCSDVLPFSSGEPAERAHLSRRAGSPQVYFDGSKRQ
jgi:hypothetical protein